MESKNTKLTPEEFRDVIRKLPEIRHDTNEFPELIRTIGREKLDKLFVADSVWSGLYEYPLEQFLALFICALGKSTDLHESVKAANPTREFHRRVAEWDVDINAQLPDGIERRHIVTLTYALQRHILSIMLYHRSLSVLVSQAAAGSDESLFLAVRVDRTVLSTPSIAVRIGRAEITDDKRFFLHLRSALKGPSGKHWEAYKDLRYSFALLREIGFDALTDAQLETLFVDQLGLYPRSASARKNLRKQITISNKIATTSK